MREQQLEATFELCWPKLNEKLESLPADGPTTRPERSERELLEELIDLARSNNAEIAEVSARTGKQLGVTQVQFDYLIKILTSASLPPTLYKAEVLGGSGARSNRSTSASGFSVRLVRSLRSGISRASIQNNFTA